MDANALLAQAWAFLEDHGFAVLGLLILFAVLRPKYQQWKHDRHTAAVMKRATDPELHKAEREAMLKARERMQARYTEVAHQSAEELDAKRRERKAAEAKEARLRKRRTDFGAGGPLNPGGSGPSRIIGGPSSRYQRRGG